MQKSYCNKWHIFCHDSRSTKNKLYLRNGNHKEMISWTLTAEFLSLIVILILGLYYYDKNATITFKHKMYVRCLNISVVYVLLNFLCIFTIMYVQVLPLWVNHLLNSLYYFIGVFACSVVASYLFYLILEHVYDKHCLVRAKRILLAINVIYFPVWFFNWKTGILFYFDSAKGYHRGDWYWLGYLLLLVELGLLVACYIKNRASVSRPMRKLMRFMPPILLMLVAFQLAFPDQIINGTIIAFADLLILISFQSVRNEYDSVTNIGNRYAFTEELSLRISGKQHFQVVIISLQQYGIINRYYGHAFGDELLYQMASQLNTLIPEGQAFRFSNVKFAIVLPYTTRDNSVNNLDKIQELFGKTWEIGDISCPVDVCYANLCYEGEDVTSTQLVKFLEYTLSVSEDNGTNSVVSFDCDAKDKLERRDYLFDLIQRRIADNGFSIHLQPVWQNGVGFTAAEALIRMKDDNGTPVSPAEFIPLAEQTGLIDELTWIVMDKSCAVLERIPVEKLKSISINLSIRQFEDDALVGHVLECINKHNIDPARLKLEVTERVLYHDVDSTISIMNRLISNGLNFYLDDFGSGYSNLEIVRTFRFQAIKFDQLLLRGFPENKESSLMIESMMDLFHNLDMRVIVEGAETKEQFDYLNAIGADFIQGYYCAKPMPEDEFEKLIMGV